MASPVADLLSLLAGRLAEAESRIATVVFALPGVAMPGLAQGFRV